MTDVCFLLKRICVRKVFSLSSKAITGSFLTGFDILSMAVNNDFIFTATKCGVIEVWLKERVTRVASIKMGGGGHGKISSLTSDANGEMLFAGTSEGKIQVRMRTIFDKILQGIMLKFRNL